MWHMRIGAVEVMRVEESLGPGFDPAFLFPLYDPAVLDEHPLLAAPALFDRAAGKLMSSIHCWLLRVGDAVVLIDTCSGNGKPRSHPAFRRFSMLDTPWLERLAACGVRPEQVTLVVNTHLHVDHVGWNTRYEGGRLVPTFPRARYLIGRDELAHWRDPEGGPRLHPAGIEVIADSVDPVEQAGLVELIADGDSILPGISVHAAPGHTAGQLIVRVASQGALGIFTADVFHQPMQMLRPEWNSCFCEVPDLAVATRRRVLREAAESGAVVFPTHTGAPHAGRVAVAGDAFRFIPVTGVSA